MPPPSPPLVRTDRPALIVGAAITALFTLEVVRTGLVMAAQDRGTLDAWVMMAIAAGAIYAVLFALGHAELRRRGSRSRGAYAALGAAAAVPPFLLSAGLSALATARSGGMLSALLVVPLATGALTGFLYHRRAGYETEGDDVDALADAIPPGEPGSAGAGLVATAGADYYDGPLVVRNSLGANAIAALLASGCFVLASTLGTVLAPATSPLAGLMHANGVGLTVLQGIIGCALPIAVLLRLTHAWMRARGRHSYRDYAMGALIGPGLFCVMTAMTGLSFLVLAYLVQFLAPSLVATLTYRKLAGLEPAPLPDDIEVRDRRTLVAANHPRRRMARVIDASR